MCSVCLCVCWRRGSGRKEGRGRTRDWYRTRERWTRWKRRGGVGGSKGLVPQQVKSIFLTSSSTTAPLSLDAECWLGRVCLCPLPKSTKTATLLQKFTQGLHKKLFYSDCPLKKKKNSEKQTAEVPNYIQNKYISLNVLMGDDEAEDDPAERDAAVVMGENRAAAAFMFHSLHLISPSVNLHCSVNMILSQHSPNKPFPYTSPSRLPISLSIQQCGAVLNSYAALCIFSVALSPRGAKAHLLAGLVWQSWLRHIQNSTLA